MSDLPVIIIGNGGHAKVLLEALTLIKVQIVGFTDVAVPNLADSRCYLKTIKYLGDDSEIFKYAPNCVRLVNGLGSTALPTRRKEIFERFQNKGYEFMSIVHPTAIISSDVVIEQGAQIMAGVIIQPGCCIGRNTIVNTGAKIDHDCIIGNHVHITPGVTLSGGVKISHDVHIGTGATLIQNININQAAIVGAGAVVIRDVMEKSMVIGVPAKEVSK